MGASKVFTDLVIEDLAEEISRQVKGLKKEGDDCPFMEGINQLLSGGKLDEVANRFVAEKKLFLESPEKELEGIYNLLAIFFLNPKITNGSALFLEILGQILEETITTRPSSFFNVLVNIYHHLEERSKLRYDVFVMIIKFTAKYHRFSFIIENLPGIESWVDQWGASIEQKRSLYLTIRETLLSADYPKEAHLVLIKYLATFNNLSSSELSASHDLAVKAIIEALSIPSIFHVDGLFALKAVEQVSSEPIYQLLQIFSKQGFKEYNEFSKSNKETIEKLGLSHDNNLKKLRLITLATLSVGQGPVSFQTVAAALEIPEEDVERWVIDAIRFKLIEAKVDQLNQQVIINKSTFRSFGEPQWKLLKERLEQWKSSVGSVLQVVQNAKIVAAQSNVTGA